MVADHPSPRDVLTGAELPAGFERWHLRLAAGVERVSTAAEWEDALVLVERGSLDVECLSGGTRRFQSGSFIALGWLPLRALRNVGPGTLELVAVRRVASRR